MVKVNGWIVKEENFRYLRKLLDTMVIVRSMKTAFQSPHRTHKDKIIAYDYKPDRQHEASLGRVSQELFAWLQAWQMTWGRPMAGLTGGEIFEEP